jgi:hypothetical protein
MMTANTMKPVATPLAVGCAGSVDRSGGHVWSDISGSLLVLVPALATLTGDSTEWVARHRLFGMKLGADDREQ